MIAETFSPDGRRVLLRDGDGDISICDAANGRLTMPLLRTHDSLASARFVGDRRLVTVAKSELVRVWELPSESAGSSATRPDERPVIDLIRIAQLLAGAKINPSQDLALVPDRASGELGSRQEKPMKQLAPINLGSALPLRIQVRDCSLGRGVRTLNLGRCLSI